MSLGREWARLHCWHAGFVSPIRIEVLQVEHQAAQAEDEEEELEAGADEGDFDDEEDGDQGDCGA